MTKMTKSVPSFASALAAGLTSPDDPAVTDEDGTASFLHSFANAMLERSLPAIREWLTGRLGPGAKIGSVAIDEGRVIVEDVHIPIGPHLWLVVDEATLDAHPEDLMAGLPPVRLRSLAGAIRAVRGSVTTFEAPLSFEGRGGSSQAWVDGELRLGGATWKLERGVGDAMPMYGTARIRITPDGWSIRDATLTSGASRTRLSATGSLRAGEKRLGEGRLETEYARLGHVLDVIGAFRGQDVRLPIPAPLDAKIDGTVSLENDGTLRADLTAHSERSDVRLRLESKGRNITSLEVEGTVAPDELLPESFDAFVDRGASEPLTVTASGRGPPGALEGRVELASPALATRGAKERHEASATLVLDGSKYTLELELEGAGHLKGELSVAPYGSIDGCATLSLLPAAWRVAEIEATGTPIEVEARIGGTRSLPDLKLSARARELAICRGDGEEISLRRLVAEATLAIEDRRARLVDAALSARVDAGSIEVRKKDIVHLKVARVGADTALRAIGLFVEQRLFGSSSDEARFAVPEGSQIWAELEIEGRRVNGTVHVQGRRSCVSLTPLRIDGRSFDGTEARATLAYDDAVALGLFEGSPLLPAGRGNAELRLRVTGEGPAMVLRASARTALVGWRLRDSEAFVELRDAELDLEIRRGALELRSLTGMVFGGRIEAAGAIRREGETRVVTLDKLSVRGASSGLRERLFGPRAGDAWKGLRVDLDLAGDLAGLSGEVTLTSERSQLAATLTTSGAAFVEGSGLRGRVDPGDLEPWLGAVTIEGDPFTLDAQLGGTWSAPTVVLTVEGGRQRVKAFGVVIPVERARLEATIGRAGARWSTLRATVAGGTIESTGVFDRGFGGTLARVTAVGVRLGSIEGVAEELGGTLHVDASIWQRLGEPIGARVSARVEEPRYEALRRLAATFSRYGLRQPQRQGEEPLTLTLHAGGGALELSDVEASVAGVFALVGHLKRSELGSWRGEARVTAKEAWLATSHLLRGPARWLGDVTVPIRVEGRGGAVRVHAEVLAALDRVLAKTRVGRGLQRALDTLQRDVLDMGPRPSSPPRHIAPSALASSDALIDRIAANAPGADAAVGALLERGFDPAEIVDRVLRRR